MDGSEHPQVVQILARVDIRAADGTPLDDDTARKIHGATSDLGVCSTAYELSGTGLLGGRVQLTYEVDEGHFWATAEHESATRVGEETLELLKSKTRADWSDGETGCFFEYLGGHLGFSVRVAWRPPLVVRQYQGQGWRFAPWTRLARACWRGDLEEAQAALDAGDDVNGRTEGLPILHGAILGGHVQVARLLIERGADVRARDLLQVQRDALRTCATCHRNTVDSVSIARMLLERGADPIGGHCDSPLDVARRRKWHGLVELLEEFASASRDTSEDAGAEFHVGDLVRIRGGPFREMVGQVVEGVSTEGAHSVKVRIEVFGRDVEVDIPSRDLCPLGSADRPGTPG